MKAKVLLRKARGAFGSLMFPIRTRAVIRDIHSQMRAGRPINIAFYVRDSEKWNMDGLFRRMRAMREFHPRIIVFPYRRKDNSIDLPEYHRNFSFFKEVDSNAIGALDGAALKSHARLHQEYPAHVIFHQQPWIHGVDLRSTSRTSLNAYTHYAYMITYNPQVHYFRRDFHNPMHVYFCQSEVHREIYLNERPEHSSKLEVAGYPKFDGVRRKYGDRSDLADTDSTARPIVIYAPHHSIGENNTFRLSTFDWNYLDILRLAESNANITWVYRPHPNLKYAVEKYKLMTSDDYLKYEKLWAGLKNAQVSYGGNYMGMFFSSSALITDCASFLAEYLLTGRPIIRLMSRNNPVKLNAVGERINDCCYQVNSVRELGSVFREVVIEGRDPLLDRRLTLRDSLFPVEQDSAEAIVNALFRRIGQSSKTLEGQGR